MMQGQVCSCHVPSGREADVVSVDTSLGVKHGSLQVDICNSGLNLARMFRGRRDWFQKTTLSSV